MCHFKVLSKICTIEPWKWPTSAWQRIHVGKNYLVLRVARSLWNVKHLFICLNLFQFWDICFLCMTSLPHQLEPDNWPQFTSSEFTLKKIALSFIQWVSTMISPYNQASHKVNCMRWTKVNIMFTYHTTPHGTLNHAPCTCTCMLFWNCQLYQCERRVIERQADQVEQHNGKVKLREINVRQAIMARNVRTD